ncbi:hypothetical protein Tco_1381847 [Tanacetum coccineum]
MMDLNHIDQLHRDDLKQKSRVKWTMEEMQILDSSIPSLRIKSSISIEEIKLVVWDCDGTKAPRPDGFKLKFLKAYRDTIKDDFLRSSLRGPLFPLLFLLVDKALQISILEACNKGLYKGTSLVSDDANISLLQYADDSFFFGNWSRVYAYNLILILKCFEEASGLKVKIAKSRLFGIRVSNIEVECVASSLGCTHDILPFMYLGLLVGMKMRSYNRWNEVVNRVRAKLSAWKAKSLFVGGRLTLVNYVLASLPIYYLSLFKAPQKVIKLLESIRCLFFWGFKESQSDFCWVKWNIILLNPSLRRLAIGSLYAKNLGLLGK